MPFLDARLPERFWSKCIPEPNSGCWLWTGAVSTTTGDSYGKIKVGERARYAHRFAYESLVGAVPGELQLDHLCRSLCVNPAHLEPVSQRENILRGECPSAINASKTHCPRGHELAGDNLVVDKKRCGRKCRKCKRTHARVWMRAKRRRLAVGA